MTGGTVIELLPKQMEYVSDTTTRHLLYSGAVGAAKSRALCHKLDVRSSKKGAVELLCRKTLESLKKSTLQTLLEPDGNLPPVLKPGTYTHNKSEKTIVRHGGGKIMYFGLDDPAKLGSVNGTGCAIDELVDLTAKDYQTLNTRVRMVADGITRQLYSACNPGPPSHWAAKRWGLDPGGVPMNDTHRVIQTKTLDNVFLKRNAPDYFKALTEMTGVAYERFVLGKWVGSDGLVYDQWDRSIHVVESANAPRRVIYSIDPGYTDPFVILEIQSDSDKRVHVSREFYKTGVDYDEAIDVLKEMMVDKDCDVVVDSQEASFIATLQNRGVRAIGCVKGADSIRFGVNLVRNRLGDPGDGHPRLTVHKDCRSTIAEFETWENEKDRISGGYKDKPVDRDNHAMDALRYGVRHLDGESGFYMAGMYATESDETEQEPAIEMPSFEAMRASDPEWGW